MNRDTYCRLVYWLNTEITMLIHCGQIKQPEAFQPILEWLQGTEFNKNNDMPIMHFGEYKNVQGIMLESEKILKYCFSCRIAKHFATDMNLHG